MLIVAGVVLLLLGVLCGTFLVAAPLGFVSADGGLALWLLFPAFSVVGYLLASAAARNSSLPLLTKGSGAVLLLLALAAAVGLVLDATSVVRATGPTLALWYVLVIGFVLGTMGLASHRKPEAA